jgi:hypothetical protein
MPKNILPPYQIITNGSRTGTAAINSNPTNIQMIDNVCISMVWTGTAVGTFKVQTCNNVLAAAVGAVSAVPASGDWIDLPLYLNGATYSPAAAGASSAILLELNQLGATWVRLVYTNASSTGTLQAYISGKGI